MNTPITSQHVVSFAIFFPQIRHSSYQNIGRYQYDVWHLLPPWNIQKHQIIMNPFAETNTVDEYLKTVIRKKIERTDEGAWNISTTGKKKMSDFVLKIELLL